MIKKPSKSPASKKPAGNPKTKNRKVATQTIEAYETVFTEINSFIDLIDQIETEIAEIEQDVAEKKAAYDSAKEKLQEAKDTRDGTKHSLYRFLRPGVGEILPLFDKMEPADEKKHGEGATEWRREPLAALKLSLPSIRLLNDADIMFVGQLQDLVQTNPHHWFEKIEGLGLGMATAIVDRLNDFIFDQGK